MVAVVNPRITRSILGLLPFLLILAMVSAGCDFERNMGTLQGSETFEVRGGQDYNWNAEVIPGKKYEVILTSADLEFTGSYLRLSVSNGEECEGCSQSIAGAVTKDGLSVSFIAPESGNARIWIYVREGNVRCILLIREKA